MISGLNISLAPVNVEEVRYIELEKVQPFVGLIDLGELIERYYEMHSVV